MIESNPEGREREVRKRHAKTAMHFTQNDQTGSFPQDLKNTSKSSVHRCFYLSPGVFLRK